MTPCSKDVSALVGFGGHGFKKAGLRIPFKPFRRLCPRRHDGADE
jgi:hypothetical protein